MERANATYSVQHWDRRAWHGKPAEIPGAKLFRLEIAYHYEGDITGEGMAQYLMTQKGNTEVNFVGLEQVTGSVGGRSGSFIFRRIGVFDYGVVRETLEVLSGSGTGDLNGLRGQAAIEHTQHQEQYAIALEYEV